MDYLINDIKERTELKVHEDPQKRYYQLFCKGNKMVAILLTERSKRPSDLRYKGQVNLEILNFVCNSCDNKDKKIPTLLELVGIDHNVPVTNIN